METNPARSWSEHEKALLLARIVSGAESVKRACDGYGLTPEQIRSWATIYRRSARQALDEHLTRTLASEGIEAGDLVAAEFSGTLAEISVADLLQTMELARKDGVITVSHHGRDSSIWCAGGSAVDAESGRARGLAALYQILALEEGRVSARFCAVQRARAIDAPTHAVLLEAARQKDEERAATPTCSEPARAVEARDTVQLVAQLLEQQISLAGEPVRRGASPLERAARRVRAGRALRQLGRALGAFAGAMRRGGAVLGAWLALARLCASAWLAAGARGIARRLRKLAQPAPRASFGPQLQKLGAAPSSCLWQLLRLRAAAQLCFARQRQRTRAIVRTMLEASPRRRGLAGPAVLGLAAAVSLAGPVDRPNAPELTRRAALARSPSTGPARAQARAAQAESRLREVAPGSRSWFEREPIGSPAAELPRGAAEALRIAAEACIVPPVQRASAPRPRFAVPMRRANAAAAPGVRAWPPLRPPGLQARPATARAAAAQAPVPAAQLRARPRWPSASDRSLRGMAPPTLGLPGSDEEWQAPGARGEMAPDPGESAEAAPESAAGQPAAAAQEAAPNAHEPGAGASETTEGALPSTEHARDPEAGAQPPPTPDSTRPNPYIEPGPNPYQDPAQ